MQTDYQIEDILSQSYDFVMYLAIDRERNPIVLIRFRYSDEIQTRLTDEVFANALAQLQHLSHPCLRIVLDGGLDSVDRYPWIAVDGQRGRSLVERVKISKLTQPELARIQANAGALIEYLGPLAGALSLSPHSIFTKDGGAGSVDIFPIDYYTWFASFARGVHPASEFDITEKMNTFFTYLNRSCERNSTPLLTGNPQEPPVPQAPLPALAPSSNFALKTTFVLLALMVSIGGGIWFATRKKEAPVPAPVIVEHSPTSRSAPPRPLPTRSGAVRSASSKKTTRPSRPRLDVSFSKVGSTNESSLKKHVGKWVRITGIISAHESNDFLLFADSSLRASLPADSRDTAENSVNKTVTIKGFLKSATLLDVQQREDIEITYLPKEIYTAKDEDQLRKMAGESVTVEAEVLRFQPSGSGKTLYLLFNSGKPEFAISILKSKAEESLSETFLKSLVGRSLRVQGSLKVESQGNRLCLVVSKKSQITE